MVQFHLGTGEIVRVERQQGIHEALEITFALDEAAHGGGVVVLAADALHHLAPVAVKCRIIKTICEP